MSLRRIHVQAAIGVVFAAAVACGVLWLVTIDALEPVPDSFAEITSHVTRMEVTDRNGVALNTTYANDWNLHDAVPVHEIPRFLIRAFIEAEDQRFFAHSGQDWIARVSALAQNIAAMREVRGASTITEQVVRMIHPRARTVWSRWLEGWEAERLERVHAKLEVLEFYLNQVPYAANRRGVLQAARYYFDRDLETLSKHEMLVLAVLVRAPSRLDLFSGDRDLLQRAVERLAVRMVAAGELSTYERERMSASDFDLQQPTLPVDARHFLGYVTARYAGSGAELHTTLDAMLQARLQPLLDQRLAFLATRRVENGALLVADHRSGEILAWLVGGAGNAAVPGRLIDTVVTPRQPGSALKPFLYALALQRGWTPATLIDDAPLAEMVGYGLHRYRNYSRTFYGRVTLRTALGNSLNIPAVRTIQFAGTADYLSLLDRLGFQSLSRQPDYYGDGLALGNGEVTLLELVQAYAALAHRGVYREFAARSEDVGVQSGDRVFSAEVASLLGNILSDPAARRLEFGSGSVLNLPVQTAVKTGTSSDYRDSWAVGYNDRYVVGVWMGNLDQTSMLGVTGSTGPALVLRGAFDVLNRHRETKALWLSPRLRRHTICADTGIAFAPGMTCRQRSEYFVPGTLPERTSAPAAVPAREIRMRQPTPGLRMAWDPRLPATQQAFEFMLQGVAGSDVVEWCIDGNATIREMGPSHVWPLSRGEHGVSATVWRDGQIIASIDETRFLVK